MVCPLSVGHVSWSGEFTVPPTSFNCCNSLLCSIAAPGQLSLQLPWLSSARKFRHWKEMGSEGIRYEYRKKLGTKGTRAFYKILVTQAKVGGCCEDQWHQRLELKFLGRVTVETRADGFMVRVCININSYGARISPLNSRPYPTCLLDMSNECMKWVCPYWTTDGCPQPCPSGHCTHHS